MVQSRYRGPEYSFRPDAPMWKWIVSRAERDNQTPIRYVLNAIFHYQECNCDPPLKHRRQDS